MKSLVRGQDGLVLGLALVVVGIGSLLVVPMLSGGTRILRSTQIYYAKTAELYAADAGLTDAIWNVKYGDFLSTVLAAPPDVTAALVPVGMLEEYKGTFLVEFSCDYDVDPNPTYNYVLSEPINGMQPNITATRVSPDRIEFSATAGDTTTLETWTSISPVFDTTPSATISGFPVENGQLVSLQVDDDDGPEAAWGTGILEIEAPALPLVVTCEDASGNVIKTVFPNFPASSG